jgi:hypothetical protein
MREKSVTSRKAIPKNKAQEKKEKNKKLVLQALTNPAFRKKLEKKPEAILGVKVLTNENKREIKMVLAKVKNIESLITHLADELLCANGPCGIGTG